jgi:hypothetical protein
MVAASRMGKIQNPVWCFSQIPFYPLPGIDNTKTNDTNLIDVLVQYLGSKFDVYIDSARHLTCETI